jgi:hypothetical protein
MFFDLVENYRTMRTDKNAAAAEKKATKRLEPLFRNVGTDRRQASEPSRLTLRSRRNISKVVH